MRNFYYDEQLRFLGLTAAAANVTLTNTCLEYLISVCYCTCSMSAKFSIRAHTSFWNIIEFKLCSVKFKLGEVFFVLKLVLFSYVAYENMYHSALISGILFSEKFKGRKIPFTLKKQF